MAAALIIGMLGLRGNRSLLPVGSRGLVAQHHDDDGQDFARAHLPAGSTVGSMVGLPTSGKAGAPGW
jgi:hypothetical protein